jgi:CheY-like chemotaxis protein/MinD-like ATPase involved in chromosome partitioning or flagellar assembly
MAHVLVIDDDAEVHPLLRVTLNKLGHQTTLALRGDEGLARALDEHARFDLVLLDLMMPGVDGFEVARRLRADARTRDMPILILTARSQAADYAEAVASGADGFLPKPFDPDGLSRKIAEVLAQAAARKTGGLGPGGGPRGQIILLLGLRGGVGTTTCAVNLAGALVRGGRRACLLELTPSGGHLALHLRLPPSPDWSSLSGTPDTSALGPFLLRHESGLVVLAAPAIPVRRGPSTATTRAILEALGGYFAYVVVDAAPSLDDATWATLGLADRTLVMGSPEVGAVQTTLGALSAIDGARRPGSLLHIGINHTMPDSLVPLAAVERALGRAPDLVVPYDRLQGRSLAQGSPLVFSQPGAPLAAAVGAYALALPETRQPTAPLRAPSQTPAP